MPQEPKRRHSRQRKGKRRASIELEAPKGILCPNCKQITLPHTVCKHCGYYDGRPVIVLRKKGAEKEEAARQDNKKA